MGFRENLREAIDYSGLAQKEVAHKAKIPLRSVENYLRDRRTIPSADKAVQIAKVLGVTVEYLVTGKEAPTINPATVDPEVQAFLRSIRKLPKNKQSIVLNTAISLSGFLSQPNKN
jgi:transcriptional regulator with XRE-family HTH domain